MRIFAHALGLIAALSLAWTGHAKTISSEEAFILKLTKHYETQKRLTAEFDQSSFVEMIHQKITKSGKLITEQPEKLRIEYTSEPLKTYISNGSKLWILDPKALTAREFDDPKNLISREALSFLAGLGHIQDLFDVLPRAKQPKDVFQITAPKLKVMALIPKDIESDILRITLGVDTKTLLVREAVLFSASGNVTHYLFKKIEFASEGVTDDFALPKKPKYKIVKKGL